VDEHRIRAIERREVDSQDRRTRRERKGKEEERGGTATRSKVVYVLVSLIQI
jgi:hypothetical protein